MKSTGCRSFCIKEIARGCKSCLEGRKLVLFISGKCSRNCFYCSLSKKRKNIDKIWANERECKTIKEVVEEARESRSAGAGITGGDPLLFLERTLKYAKALKRAFGKNFHIHIYVPTTLITKEKLKKLSCVIDEIRIHPSFLAQKQTEKEVLSDIKKIQLASSIFGKENTGIELPMIPNRKQNILEFAKLVSRFIGFLNLNEFEISDTNFRAITRRFKLNRDTYTIAGSKSAGLWVLKQLAKLKLNLKAHLCTAETKNLYQYKNRLKLHKILPFGYQTEEGTVRYYAIYAEDNKPLVKLKKELKGLKSACIDEKKKRIILSESTAKKLHRLNKYKIARVEEYPTYDAIEVEKVLL